MKHSNSDVSIDQVACLAGQAGVYQHENTREFDRAMLASATSISPAAAGMSPVQRILRAVIMFVRGFTARTPRSF